MVFTDSSGASRLIWYVCLVAHYPSEATAVVNVKKSNKVRTQTGMIAQ